MAFDIIFLKRVILSRLLNPIHRDGYPFITLIAIGTVIIGLFWDTAFVLGIIALLICVYIFRNPDRVAPRSDGVIAPADGTIEDIQSVTLDAELGLGFKKAVRISILTGLGDAHVTRVPVSGFVKESRGGFGVPPAEGKEASLKTCQYQMTVFEDSNKNEIGVLQRAGPFKRLIIFQLKEEQIVSAGDVSGIVRFFSHSDIYVPEHAMLNVVLGQKCLAGETILADINPVADAKKQVAVKKAK